MIRKILKIKNFGKFLAPTFSKENWNGVIEQTNIIYAQNGSGKTTLSLLFRSLKGNDELVAKKKSFSSKEPPEIVLLNGDNKEIKFTKTKWTKHIADIQIFDSFYIEDNVYIITIADNPKKPNFFEIILGEESVKIRKRIDEIILERQKLRKKRQNQRARVKKINDSPIKDDLNLKIYENLAISKKLDDEIKKLEKSIIDNSLEVRERFLVEINRYLKMFNHNLQLTKLDQLKHRVLYGLKINGHEIRTNDKANYSLKYSLSEGDKNSLALSFFFAKLELIENLNEITLIVDDPLSSLDYSRKNTTLNNLISFSKKVKCFILLSHDLSFANDFSRRLNYQCQNLKIITSGGTSSIQLHDIETETLTGIFKDLTVLNNFLDLGANSDSERRDVIRCIRPAIEGIFRIKFFKKILKTEWLGDMISKIRESQEGSIFYRLKAILNELIEINDYSKEYHHSNPYNLEVPINDEELRNYIVRTLKVIETI